MVRRGSAFILLFFLCGLCSFVPKIGIVEASGTVHIMTDGSINPPTPNIMRNGDLYILVGNITSDSDGVVIEKSNIVLDGSNYYLQGNAGSLPLHYSGIWIKESNNVTIKNMNIALYGNGIYLYNSSGNVISENNIIEGIDGIRLTESSNHNEISRNNITTNSNFAVILWNSSTNRVFENNITHNGRGFVFDHSSCNNIVFENNIAENDETGIRFDAFSSTNVISRNNISANAWGIDMTWASNIMVSENNFCNNSYGIRLDYCSNIRIFQNNFVNNTIHVFSYESANSWDNGSQGNYWSDYAGLDTNGDGIGDTSYIIDADNIDYYPLIATHVIPEFPSFLILPLFTMATPLAVIVYRRKRSLNA